MPSLIRELVDGRGTIDAARAHRTPSTRPPNAGTGIETSITGKFKLEVVKAAAFGDMEAALDFPLGETATHWIVHSFVRVRRPSRTFNVRAPMESGATPTPSTRFITS